MPEPAQLRILVVEDEASIRRVLVRFLRARGCAVSEAADGNEGLSALRGAAFDVVVSDVAMPRLDGVAFWEQALRAGIVGSAGFVFITAVPLPAVLALPAAVKVIAKPFALDDVWVAVRQAAGGP